MSGPALERKRNPSQVRERWGGREPEKCISTSLRKKKISQPGKKEREGGKEGRKRVSGGKIMEKEREKEGVVVKYWKKRVVVK